MLREGVSCPIDGMTGCQGNLGCTDKTMQQTVVPHHEADFPHLQRCQVMEVLNLAKNFTLKTKDIHHSPPWSPSQRPCAHLLQNQKAERMGSKMGTNPCSQTSESRKTANGPIFSGLLVLHVVIKASELQMPLGPVLCMSPITGVMLSFLGALSYAHSAHSCHRLQLTAPHARTYLI